MNVDDYVQQGIHGVKETKPDERRKFLGTLRERVIIALTQSQVMEPEVYKEVEAAMKSHRKAHLYLNGHIDYSYLSKYIKVANQLKVGNTIVTNKEHNSEIGLLLAYDYAIDKEEIYINKTDVKKPQSDTNSKKGLFSVFGKIFGK